MTGSARAWPVERGMIGRAELIADVVEVEEDVEELNRAVQVKR